MPSRRTHTKSRHGCLQCKASHVKCDLGRPICARCVKTEKSCQFQNRDGGSGPATPSEVSKLPQTIKIPEDDPFTDDNTVPWDDLELLHHFLMATADTFADRPDLRQMWKIQVPKLAMKQKFLMHLLFSVTALHIASSDVEKQSFYINKALRHHDIALPHFSSKLPTVTRENGESIFVGAAMIVLSSLNLALSRVEHESLVPLDEMFGIFILLRGLKFVSNETWEWVMDGEIAALFAGRAIDDSVCVPDDIMEALRTLTSSSQLKSDSVHQATYLTAIEGLETCFKILATESQDFGMVFNWPVLVSQEYIDLLSLRRPMALVVLAFFAVVLHEVRDRWWVSARGIKLVRDIHQMLDDEWKGLIQWPLRRILPRESILLLP